MWRIVFVFMLLGICCAEFFLILKQMNKMKILHVIDDLTMGGGQNLLIGLTAGQIEKGNEVVVLQLKKSKDMTVTKKIEINGVKVEFITEDGSLYNPLMIIKLIPWIKKADVVHVHLFPALYWAGIARMISFCKTPMIYTEHSTQNRRRNNILLRNIDNIIYNKCYKKVVACADKALETFNQVYPSVKHLCAINNGVNTKLYADAEPYKKQQLLGISEDCFVVTMVARFMFMKRQDTIVEAISKLPDSFHACFVGSEPNDEGLLKVKKKAEELNVKNRIHFLYLRSDVPRILKTSDVIMMSSKYEGLSLSSIEGMAAGKPFVATDVNGLREVVQGAGVLFELNNSDELAKILMKLNSDKEYYKMISDRCKVRASLYDIQKMIDGYMNLYQEFVKL